MRNDDGVVSMLTVEVVKRLPGINTAADYSPI